VQNENTGLLVKEIIEIFKMATVQQSVKQGALLSLGSNTTAQVTCLEASPAKSPDDNT
jgi:hypothetical protein